MGASAPTKGGGMIFSKDDLDCLNSLYYNFSSFDIRLGRDPKVIEGEQWQISAPNKNKLWLTGTGITPTEAFNGLMQRMAETGHFESPEWLGAGA